MYFIERDINTLAKYNSNLKVNYMNGTKGEKGIWASLSAKVGTTSPTSGGRSVGIVRSRTKAMEFSFSFFQL
jgi:hypothetical protein